MKKLKIDNGKLIIVGFFCLAFSIFNSQLSIATVLGDAAAKLAPGQWAIVPMSNVSRTVQSPDGWDPGATGGAYDGSQPAWNSNLRRLYLETAEHGRGAAGLCGIYTVNPDPTYDACWRKLQTYDADTDTWSIGGNRVTDSANAGPNLDGFVDAGHVYNHVAWDDVNQVMYVRSYGSSFKIYRYCVNAIPSYCKAQGAGNWAYIGSNPSYRNSGGYEAIVFHEALNGGTLLYYDGNGYASGCGGLYGFREGVGWSTISETNCGLPGANNATLANYSHIKQVVVFGGGDTAPSNHFWRIDSSGTITALDNAPCGMSNTNSSGSNGGFASFIEDPVSGDFIIVGCSIAGQLWRLNPTAAPGVGAQWTQLDANLGGTGEICEGNTSEFCPTKFFGSPISTYGVIGYWKWKQTSPPTAEYWIYKATASAVVGSDFNTRCTSPGVIRCVGFDSSADVPSTNYGITGVSTDGTTMAVLDTSIKASGNSSLKFTIPISSGPNNSGNYFLNLSDDFRTVFPCHGESYMGTTCVQKGTGNDYYIQFRARFDPYYITNQYSGGGWKLAWIGNLADKPGCGPSSAENVYCVASCTDLELVMQNTNHYNVGPLGYYACPGHNYQTDFYTLNFPNPGDINLQNAMPSPYCIYPPSTAKGCFGWFGNEWMTFQAHIHVDNPRTFVDAACGGVLCRDYPSSYIEVWAAREGQPSQLVTTKSFPIWAGANADDQRYGKVWLTAYDSGRVAGGADATQVSYVWFDELIISTNKIADPGSSSVAAPANVTLTRRRIQ